MTSEQLGSGLRLYQMTSEQLGSGLRLHQMASEQFSSGLESQFMAPDQSSSGPALHEMTTATNIAGLIPKPPSSAPFVPPIRNEWETLLQPLFDEYSRTQPNVDAPVSEVAALVPAVSTSTPSSTSVDQEAPLLSTSQTSQESPSHVKLDELGGVLKNKARLVARGYRQEEDIDFKESFAPVASELVVKEIEEHIHIKYRSGIHCLIQMLCSNSMDGISAYGLWSCSTRYICIVIIRVSLLCAATMFNIHNQSILSSDFTL
ncbi:hypothetical protein Tco_0659259 [Tanacetum coccineum]